MSEGFLECLDLNPKEVRQRVLQQINGFLESMGKTISLFDFVSNNFSSFDIENQKENWQQSES